MKLGDLAKATTEELQELLGRVKNDPQAPAAWAEDIEHGIKQRAGSRGLAVVVACPVPVYLRPGTEELSQVLRALNDAHLGSETLPLDEEPPAALLAAHVNACTFRKALLDVEVRKDGGLVPRFMTLDGVRYRMVADP